MSAQAWGVLCSSRRFLWPKGSPPGQRSLSVQVPLFDVSVACADFLRAAQWVVILCFSAPNLDPVRSSRNLASLRMISGGRDPGAGRAHCPEEMVPSKPLAGHGGRCMYRPPHVTHVHTTHTTYHMPTHPITHHTHHTYHTCPHLHLHLL